MLVGHQTQEEMFAFLNYVSAIEGLLNGGDQDDMFGTEGWRHRIGIVD